VLLGVAELLAVPFVLLTFVAIVLPATWDEHAKLIAILVFSGCAVGLVVTAVCWMRDVRRTFESPRADTPEAAVRRFLDELLGPGPANSYAAWLLLADEARAAVGQFDRLEQAAEAWAKEVKRAHDMPGALIGLDSVSTMPLEAADRTTARVVARVDFARRIEPDDDDDIHTEVLSFDVRAAADGAWLITAMAEPLTQHLDAQSAQ
jgi:hypothetical protein